jgi:hypothetical protein
MRRADLSDREFDALERVCTAEGIDTADMLRLLEIEASFRDMGKRRGLFDALRTVVEGAAMGSTKAADEAR